MRTGLPPCRSLVNLDRGVLLQTLLYLPSKDVWRAAKGCRDLLAPLIDGDSSFRLWQRLEDCNALGSIARDAIWLHTTVGSSKIAEVIEQTRNCFLAQTCRLSAVDISTLVSTLQFTEPPWNPEFGRSVGTTVISPWVFHSADVPKLFEDGAQLS